MKVYGLKAFFKEQKGNIREIRAIWALEEVGAPYELVLLDPKSREHKSEEFLKINPFGKVPAIVDGDLALFESAAICNYIGDKYGKLIPDPKTPARAKYDQWVFASLATLEPQTVRVFACDYFYPQNDITAAIREQALRILSSFLKALDRHLAENDYVLGDDFSIADIAFMGGLNFLRHTDVLREYKALSRYVEKLGARPAYQRALELNGALA